MYRQALNIAKNLLLPLALVLGWFKCLYFAEAFACHTIPRTTPGGPGSGAVGSAYYAIFWHHIIFCTFTVFHNSAIWYRSDYERSEAMIE